LRLPDQFCHLFELDRSWLPRSRVRPPPPLLSSPLHRCSLALLAPPGWLVRSVSVRASSLSMSPVWRVVPPLSRCVGAGLVLGSCSTRKQLRSNALDGQPRPVTPRANAGCVRSLPDLHSSGIARGDVCGDKDRGHKAPTGTDSGGWKRGHGASQPAGRRRRRRRAPGAEGRAKGAAGGDLACKDQSRSARLRLVCAHVFPVQIGQGGD